MIPLKKIAHMRMGLVLLALISGGAILFYTQTGRRERPMKISSASGHADGNTIPISPDRAVTISTGEIKVRSAQSTLRQSSPPEASQVAALQDALDGQSALPLSSRLSALRAIGFEVSRADWEVVREFVGSPERFATLNSDQLRYIKNEAMTALIRANLWLDEAAEVFKVVHSDPRQDVGVRDYALQFLAVVAEKDARIGWGFHWQVLEGENKDFATAAALHLMGAAQRGELIREEQAKLAAAALKMVSQDSLTAPNRATVLQVCAELGVREAGNIAEAISRDENADLVARLSAIAALGKLGGSREMEIYMRSLASGSDRRLHAAAVAALARFKVREG